MKTFQDLEFKPHQVADGLIGRMEFDNNYGVSVVRFKMPNTNNMDDMIIGICNPGSEYGSYTDNETEWEVAILKNGSICYDTHITDDVIGHCSEDRVTEIMQKVQELEK